MIIFEEVPEKRRNETKLNVTRLNLKFFGNAKGGRVEMAMMKRRVEIGRHGSSGIRVV